MAWAYVQSDGLTGFETAFTVPFPGSVAAGSLLLVFYATLGSSSNEVVSVTDTVGSTYSLISHRSGFGAGLTGYAAVSAGAGANTVTYTLSGGRVAGLIVLEYTGTLASSPMDQVDGTDAASGSAASDGDETPSVTPTTDGQLIVGVIFPVNGAGTTTFSPGTSPVFYAERDTQDVSGWTEIQVQDVVQTTAASIKSTWTATAADNYHSIIATFKAAASGAPAFTRRLLLTGTP